MKKLENSIKLKFKDKKLLKQAMTHRSYINEHSDLGLEHNERLEFLGDAVLELIVTEYLFLTFSDKSEGELTSWRASLVNSKMLYKVAQKLNLEEYLLLSKGESQDKDSKARQYILANSVEALIGAIYLDQGTSKAKDFIFENIVNDLDEIIKNKSYLDPKSNFQEKAQDLKGITPSYKVLKEEGPDHNKVFSVGVFLDVELVATGTGSSKQEAQTDAAQKALEIKNWN
jgi:ribonuclease III